MRSDLLGVEAKFQIDAPITDRLFWAMNVNFATAGQQDEVTNRWSSSSASAVSTALAYSLADGKVFVGAEVRWIQGYENAVFGKRTEYAVFMGPTLQAKLAENVSFNVDHPAADRRPRQPTCRATSISIHSTARLFRVKLAVGF